MIIVGLGNPGKEYDQTRHNVGFLVVEKLAEKLQAADWKSEFGVRWTKVGEHTLIEPMEFMNNSGPTLQTFLKKKRRPENYEPDLFVIHDDVDFPLGELHEQFDRSAAGHNGVQSIIGAYGQKFSRLRVGIGSNQKLNIPAEDYVVQRFSAEEMPIIEKAIDQAVGMLMKKISGT